MEASGTVLETLGPDTVATDIVNGHRNPRPRRIRIARLDGLSVGPNSITYLPFANC